MSDTALSYEFSPTNNQAILSIDALLVQGGVGQYSTKIPITFCDGYFYIKNYWPNRCNFDIVRHCCGGVAQLVRAQDS